MNIFSQSRFAGFTMLYKSSLMYCYPITVCWSQTVGRQVVKKTTGEDVQERTRRAGPGVCLTTLRLKSWQGKSGKPLPHTDALTSDSKAHADYGICGLLKPPGTRLPEQTIWHRSSVILSQF